MTATTIAFPGPKPTDRDPALPTLPQLPSLAELGPYLSRRLAQCRRSGEQLVMLWIEVSPLPAPTGPANEATKELLRVAGRRVRNRVRGTDEVVQVGEEGFAVLLMAAAGASAALVAQRLKQALNGAYGLDGQRAYLAVALGEAIYPDDGRTGTELAEAAQRSLALRFGG